MATSPEAAAASLAAMCDELMPSARLEMQRMVSRAAADGVTPEGPADLNNLFSPHTSEGVVSCGGAPPPSGISASRGGVPPTGISGGGGEMPGISASGGERLAPWHVEYYMRLVEAEQGGEGGIRVIDR